MTDARVAPPAGGAQSSQTAPVRNVVSTYAPTRTFTVRELADAYMASYRGRDRSRVHYLVQWCDVIGDLPAVDVDSDCVADWLEHFRTKPARRFLGRDAASGEPRWKELGLRKPVSLNRLKSSLSALFAWSKDRRRRLLPTTWPNPCRDIPAEPENNARVRFLSHEERERLLKAARVSAWPRLYLLIVLALTTGARRPKRCTVVGSKPPGVRCLCALH